MITLSEAKRQQDQLQAQGKQLLSEFDLAMFVKPIGQLILEGSFTYGLMVKPDIDARIYSDEPSVDVVSNLLKPAAMNPLMKRTMLVDYTTFTPSKGMPVGIYLGLRYLFEDVLWNFDIWVIRPADELGREFHSMTALTPDQRDQILLLKYQLNERGLYPGNSRSPDSFSSADLYRAVLRDGAVDLQSLKQWRADRPGANNS